MEFCWHGSASFGFRLGNKEFIVDPSFSQQEQYGSWYEPNFQSPSFERYYQMGCPSYLLITHGHPAHFDVHTIKRLLNRYALTIIGSAEVCEAAGKIFMLPTKRFEKVTPGQRLSLDGVTLEAIRGVHWFTQPESVNEQESSLLPEKYANLPYRGPMLGFLLTSDDGSIYISGDTEISGVPLIETEIAVICVGGRVPHPVTKTLTKSIMDEDDLVIALEERIKAQAVIPVHYDYSNMQEISITTIIARAEATRHHPKVLIPPYNTWVEIP